MMTDDDQKVAKVAQIFYCVKCDYKCIKKSNFEKHLTTVKHKKQLHDDQIMTNDDQKVAKVAQLLFTCECGKKYKYKQGLSVHKKNCKFFLVEQSDNSNNQLTISNDVVLKLLNDNQELKNIIVQQQTQISELIPKVGNNNNNTINNNQKFNINVFLNEKCKDAINMSDFVKSLHVTLEQLDFTKQNGLADGISKTIIDNMNKLSIYERPMHCTDIKRETLYIKEYDEWTKDNNKEKIKHAIKKTSSKNYNALNNWKDENPDFSDNENKSEFFSKTISTIGKPTDIIDDKIIIIIEKKFQQGGGSVVEKLQTPVNKIRNLKRRYPTYKIHYIYWLSEWFQTNTQAELLDLTEDYIPYFIGISENIKIQVISQIINCK